MRKRHVFLFVLSFCTIVDAGSVRHSLYVLSTYIIGDTPFPEFTAVGMLDDVQVAYLDSNTDKVVRFGHDIERKESDITPMGVHVVKIIQGSMKDRQTHIKHSFNLTKGIPNVFSVQQNIAGCEMLPNGEAAVIFSTRWTESPWTGETREYLIMRQKHIFLPICINELKNLLEKQKKVLLHRVRPRILFLEKAVLGGALVSCLATDFYPRHINLTLLRDSQPVAEQELTGGAVLPNGNGLYQVRKTLEISTQELRERHNYTCTASHLSLDSVWSSQIESSQSSWQPEFSREHRVPILLSSVAMWIFFILIIFCIGVKMRKCPEPRTTLQSANIDAQVTETLNPSSNSDT